MSELPFLPVIAGIDNVHSADHDVFQLRTEREQPATPAVLKKITNLDLASDGKLTTRAGVTELVSLLEGKRLVTKAGLLFAVDGDVLYLVLPANNNPLLFLLNGFDSGVFNAHNWPTGSSQVFISSGTIHKVFKEGVLSSWGLPVPGDVTYEVIDGTVPAGKYLCAATFRDGAINNPLAQESGAQAPVEIELTATGGLRLSVLTENTDVSYVSFYLSAVNQAELFRIATVPLVNTGAGFLGQVDVVADFVLTETPLLTQGWGPPPENISAVGSVQSFMLVAVGRTLYRSWPGRPGLFYYSKALQLFPGTIRTIVGLEDGVYVGTDAGLFWLGGERPEEWKRDLAAPIRVIPDGLAIPGAAIPALETGERVVVFASGRGLIVGLPGGKVIFLTQNRYHFSGSRVSIALKERQLFIGAAP
jgi:hypothetical protein